MPLPFGSKKIPTNLQTGSVVPLQVAPIGSTENGQQRESTIHTERYSAWNGTLTGRAGIVRHTIYQGFRHILSNKWVKILIALLWLINLLFPLFIASFGGSNLIQGPDDGGGFDDWDEAYDLVHAFDVDFPYSQSIEAGEIAIYNISVKNTGERTDVVDVRVVYADMDWYADLFTFDEVEAFFSDAGEDDDDDDDGEEYDDEEEDSDGEGNTAVRGDDEEDDDDDDDDESGLNFTLSAGELASFALVVMPPEYVVSGTGTVYLEAESRGARIASSGFFDEDEEDFEIGSMISAVTVVGHSEGSPYHFVMTTDSVSMTERKVKANEEVGFPVTINNTGTVDESFMIRVDGLPKKWNHRFEGLEILPENLTGEGGKDQYGVYLQPGENRTFTVYYDTPKYPSKTTLIGVTATSVNDQSLSGGVVTIVQAKDIPDRDMTSEVVSGLYNDLFMTFVLFLAAVAGSRAISEDRAQKSFTIYFARPVKKIDYIAIKFGSVGAVLCFGALVPILVTYAGLILFSGVDNQYLIDHLWVWSAIVLHSLLIVAVFTSLTLACSSITSRRFYAAFGLVVTYLITDIIANIVRDVFHEKKGTAADISHSIDQVGTKIFDVPDVKYSYEWTYNLLVLVTIIVLCVAVISYKVWKTELSE